VLFGECRSRRFGEIERNVREAGEDVTRAQGAEICHGFLPRGGYYQRAMRRKNIEGFTPKRVPVKIGIPGHGETKSFGCRLLQPEK
jgi:hypothetical protein